MNREPYIGMPIIMGHGSNQPQWGNADDYDDNMKGNMENNGNSQGLSGNGSMYDGNAVMNGNGMNGANDGTINAGEIGCKGNVSGFDASLLGSLPLASAYVPFQQWKTTYSLEGGLSRGTIFPELDLPFKGGMR